MAAKKKEESIAIKPFTIKEATIRIVGDSPYISHNWDEKAKRMLPAGKRAMGDSDITKEKEYKTPMESFINSLYWISHKPTEYTEEAFQQAVEEGAEWGFRVEGIKQAMIDAAYLKGWISKKTVVRGQLFIKPDAINEDGFQLVKIHGEPPILQEDVVVLSGMGRVPDLRWRGAFKNWWADVTISYDADGEYTLQDFINMLNASGRYCGIGEWRPEKDGQYGMFHVDTAAKSGKK